MDLTMKQRTNTLGRIALVLGWGSMLLLGLAGASKFLDLAEFVSTLKDWGFASPFVRHGVGLMVPSAEVVLSLVWVLAIERLWTTRAAIALVVLFTGLYLSINLFSRHVSCGCMGRVFAHVAWTDTLWFTVSRNALMVGCLVVFLLHARPARDMPARAIAPRSRASAFTLVEVLVCIAVLAVILAIVLPALGGSRGKSNQTRCLASAASHAAIMVHYTQDHREYFPSPPSTSGIIRYSCVATGFTAEGKYFDLSIAWPVMLADAYYDGKLPHPSFDGRDLGWHDPWSNSFLYPHSFMARPEYWVRETRRPLPEQLSGTGQKDVLFPSAKVLITESCRLHRGEPSWESAQGNAMPAAAFVDGHGGIPLPGQRVPGGLFPLDSGLRFESVGGYTLNAPFLCTENGVRGRDIR